MRNLKKLIAILSALALLCTVFVGVDLFASALTDEVAAFQAAMAEKEVLTAGTIAEIADTDMWLGMVRSKEGIGGVKNEDPMSGFNNYHQIINASTFNANNNLGDLFGYRNEDCVCSYSSATGWMGTSVVYNVVPGTYVATVLNMEPNMWGQGMENGFRFEVSANGAEWTVVNPTVTAITGWASTQQIGHGTAVVQIPEGARYYRITMRDFNDSVENGNLWEENTWTTATTQDNTYIPGFNGYGIGTSMVSAYDLNNITHYSDIPDIKILSEFEKKMAEKDSLVPGVLVEADDTDYYLGMLRSVTGPSGRVFTGDPYTPFNEYTAVADSSEYIRGVMSHPAGDFFGLANYKVRTYNSRECWIGAAQVYNVVPGTQVAAVVTANQNYYYEGIFANGFRYDVSNDGITWTQVTPEINKVNTWTPGYCQLANAVAVLEIPENVNYYRITMAGWNPDLITDGFVTENLWNPTGYDDAPDAQFVNAYYFSGIGAVMAADTFEGVENYADIPHGFDVTAPAGVTVSKTENVKKRETITITVADNLVAGSLKANGVAVFAKGDTDVAGEGAGNVFKYTVTANADVEITAEFKDTVDITVEDNFATVAASINTETRALRFLNRVYVDGDKIRIGEELYTIKSVGALIVPEYMLTDWDYTAEDLDHSRVDDGEVYAVDVAVNVLYDKTAKYVDFTTGVRGLVEYTQVEDILVRAYVIYEDANGVEQYAYADVQRANYAALNGGETTPEA